MERINPPRIITPYNRVNEEYKLLRVLGEGGFGKCYEAKKGNGQVFAIKVLSKLKLRGKESTKERITNEIKIHKAMNHPNIVSFYDYFEDINFVYIVMELCENKTLADMLRKRRFLTEAEVRYYMLQILDACNYMHQNMMIHRDLKLANLFLSADMRVKIGDFGLTAKLNLMGDKKTSMCGTVDYMAPEIIGRIGHSFEVDLWSIGVIMYIMLYGIPPFHKNRHSQIFRSIRGGHFGFPTSVNNCVSKEAKALIQSILNRNPNQRPTINEIFNHDFFKTGFTPQQIPTSALTVAPNFDNFNNFDNFDNFDNFCTNNETTEISDNSNSRSQISLSTVRSSGSSELNGSKMESNGSKSVKIVSQVKPRSTSIIESVYFTCYETFSSLTDTPEKRFNVLKIGCFFIVIIIIIDYFNRY
ncbi:hypothetical protein Glove_615g24 [Diversispora epigaea]|uniref:Protein kinase domain-containing protein n=1 Tax=Diversispora epigaea TaxID=1348612 RepID=A0A397G6D6_9GLOM|nr:hypothetical protein Glove_615g24 [Diversispora epigaea]